MTIAPRRQPSRTKRNRTSLLFERGMALLASANLVLVLFDLSYIPLRNFWLQGRVQFYARIAKYEWKFPAEPVRILPVNVTHAYDWVKGIEENRDTAYYLQRVEDLQAKIQQINDLTLRSTGSNNGIVGSGDRQDITTQLRRYNQEQEAILAELRELSVEMVDTNPFEIANKTGTLEKIKIACAAMYLAMPLPPPKTPFNSFGVANISQKMAGVKNSTFTNAKSNPS